MTEYEVKFRLTVDEHSFEVYEFWDADDPARAAKRVVDYYGETLQQIEQVYEED